MRARAPTAFGDDIQLSSGRRVLLDAERVVEADLVAQLQFAPNARNAGAASSWAWPRYGKNARISPGHSSRRGRRRVVPRCLSEPRFVATKLGFLPRRDGEIATGRHQTRRRVLGLVGLAVFRIGDHQIDQAKAGTARVHTLEGGDRFIEPSRQAIGIAEDAEIHRRVVGIER